MKIATLLFIAFVTISSFSFAQSVNIGAQTWTTKNLDVATFRNGDAIPQAKTDEEWKAAGKNKKAAWCYYENDVANGIIYGKLYNWYAVNDNRGLAPLGWHVPTDQEWTVLSNFLGGADVAGKKMKSSSGWLKNGNGTNSSGFAGLPGGGRSNSYGSFDFVGGFGMWWSSSEYFEAYAAWKRELSFDESSLYRSKYDESDGLSVRCVKD